MNMIDPEKVSALAHQYWEKEGRPEGRSAEHWTRAESELQQALESDHSPLEEPPSEPHCHTEP